MHPILPNQFLESRPIDYRSDRFAHSDMLRVTMHMGAGSCHAIRASMFVVVLRFSSSKVISRASAMERSLLTSRGTRPTSTAAHSESSNPANWAASLFVRPASVRVARKPRPNKRPQV